MRDGLSDRLRSGRAIAVIARCPVDGSIAASSFACDLRAQRLALRRRSRCPISRGPADSDTARSTRAHTPASSTSRRSRTSAPPAATDRAPRDSRSAPASVEMKRAPPRREPVIRHDHQRHVRRHAIERVADDPIEPDVEIFDDMAMRRVGGGVIGRMLRIRRAPHHVRHLIDVAEVVEQQASLLRSRDRRSDRARGRTGAGSPPPCERACRRNSSALNTPAENAFVSSGMPCV